MNRNGIVVLIFFQKHPEACIGLATQIHFTVEKRLVDAEPISRMRFRWRVGSPGTHLRTLRGMSLTLEVTALLFVLRGIPNFIDSPKLNGRTVQICMVLK